jgi:hypothetical protein
VAASSLADLQGWIEKLFDGATPQDLFGRP